jgi:hypothetical protein
MNRVLREYLNITSYNTENKVNDFFDIKEASMELYQRVEDYQINQLIIKTHRKYNYSQVRKYLSDKMNPDIANRIISDYLPSYDLIRMKIDIHYDPLLYPTNEAPSWRLCELVLVGLYSDIEEIIRYMIVAHNQIILKGCNPANFTQCDIIYFMSKFLKLLKNI